MTGERVKGLVRVGPFKGPEGHGAVDGAGSQVYGSWRLGEGCLRVKDDCVSVDVVGAKGSSGFE